jgi:uncharacterized protein YoxC
MELKDILAIVEILALLALTILCIYLVTIIVRVRNILNIVESDLKEFSTKAIPILDNLDIITNKIRSVTENIDEQVEIVKGSIRAIKEVADNIVGFERRVQSSIEEPVFESIGAVAAVVKGVRAFFSRLWA